ncbi:uncharacterized protein CANTADRAFT_6759 [Suhomyces tanzawaensis NRRL Y-17324]|uniref:Topoisomerase I damage affected protein 2 n=1 Tax=Suhomyces tanzawaensis NRRL Y-17324 TaxID=984487 RepID=A0A1E4SFT3_9ASCO|nr:uncharacterized protein CANTADRAFT_6759 [Suhomyces tanzawaensis NRRL Y-17324]ODV78367.1 hypothetical protein CANTADRAFT_6759 [Suhomyces tanzawaensis NRRL Y-17324]
MSVSITSSSISKEAPISAQWLVELVQQLGPIDSGKRNQEVLEKLQAKSSKYKFLVQSTDVQQLGDIGLNTKFGAIWDSERDGHINLQIGDFVKEKPEEPKEEPASEKSSDVALEEPSHAADQSKEPVPSVAGATDELTSKPNTESPVVPKIAQEALEDDKEAGKVSQESEGNALESANTELSLEIVSVVPEEEENELKAIEDSPSDILIESPKTSPEIPKRPSSSGSKKSTSSIPTPFKSEKKPQQSGPKPIITMLSVYWLYVR